MKYQGKHTVLTFNIINLREDKMKSDKPPARLWELSLTLADWDSIGCCSPQTKQSQREFSVSGAN